MDVPTHDDDRYTVPALARAHQILALVAERAGGLRMIDIVKGTGLNKSSVFSLLKTMTRLGWLASSRQGTYEIGETLAVYGSSRLYRFDVVRHFHSLAQQAAGVLEGAYQLSVLDKTNVLYLAKVTSKNSVRVPTYPGLRLPAHCTAMGKAMLSALPREELDTLFGQDFLEKVTMNTVADLDELYHQLRECRHQGYALEVGEAMSGYSCVGAPVRNHSGGICAAVSLTTSESYPSPFFERAAEVVTGLARDIAAALGS